MGAAWEVPASLVVHLLVAVQARFAVVNLYGRVKPELATVEAVVADVVVCWGRAT